MYEFYSERNFELEKKTSKIKKYIFIFVFLVILSFSFFLFKAPKNFPEGEIITIEPGYSLNEISKIFEEKEIVKSASIFESLIVLMEGDKTISSGDYVFNSPLNVFDVAKRVANSDFGVGKIEVTLPEGLNIKEMSNVLFEKLPNFNSEEFMFLTKDLEGYLFPDTYFFFASDDAKDVVKILKNTFDKKIRNVFEDEVKKSGKDFKEILIMASIIEDEAYDGMEEKQTISGILWKRIDEGMRLQVDATLRYVNGKASSELTLDDLAEDHEYNTYTRYGLPPTPISNPGVDSFKAALSPIDSPYFFYLHDEDGKIYYAKTFEEHRKNIANYLK